MSRTPHLISIISFTLVCATSLITPALAGELYRSVESDGTLAFTNVPSEGRFKPVPPERSSGGPGVRMEPRQLAPAVARHAHAYEVDPALVWAVMKAESDFKPHAVSSSGAMGLMQLMPETARRLDVDPFDPEDSIAGGTRYLRYLLDRFRGNLPRALAAYNAGATRVESYRALPPIDETRRYVAKVLRFYRSFAQSRPDRSASRRHSHPAWVDTLSLSRASR